MLGLSTWNTFNELNSLHRDLDALFGRVFGDTLRSQLADASAVVTPPVDVKRDGENWVVAMALPGISPEQVDVEIVGGTLRVRGERTEAAERAEPILNEIRHGRFERELTLPQDIDVEHVRATYRHGMLELTLPLKESAKPRRIAIATEPESKQLRAA
jgi:HSP20 family protein